MRLAILASREGTTLQAVLDAVSRGGISARVAVVISNNRESGALRRAHSVGVPTAHLSSATHPDPEQLDRAILEALTNAQVDVVLLAGYLKKLGPQVLEEYRGRILNSHPALLPKFGGKGMYGSHVHEAVLASGDAESGVSIHLVDAEYDTGPVLAQCRVPVLPGDSAAELAARVQAREREFVVETLAKIEQGTLLVGSLAKAAMAPILKPPYLVIRDDTAFWVETRPPEESSATLQAFEEGCFEKAWCYDLSGNLWPILNARLGAESSGLQRVLPWRRVPVALEVGTPTQVGVSDIVLASLGYFGWTTGSVSISRPRRTRSCGCWKEHLLRLTSCGSCTMTTLLPNPRLRRTAAANDTTS